MGLRADMILRTTNMSVRGDKTMTADAIQCITTGNAGGRVLEVGCGTGASARWLARQGYQVKALDISAVALQAAATAAAAEQLSESNPQWVQQDIFQLQGCEECAYDFIYDCQGQHKHDPVCRVCWVAWPSGRLCQSTTSYCMTPH